MSKKTCAVLLGLVVLTGCTKEYQSNMNARKEIAWVQTTNQRVAVGDVMAVVERILKPIEEQARLQQEGTLVPVLGSSSKMPSGDNYAMFLMAEMMGKFIDANARAEVMRARAQAINYMVPIIEAIYSQHLSDFGTPMSSNAVLSKLVGNIPFVATVGGMYALGAKGLDAAGDTITASISGGSTMNNNSTSATNGGTIGADNTQQESTYTQTEDFSTDNSQNETLPGEEE